MIVGLGHQAQVGKDTAASILVEKYGFKRLAFADKLKEMALAIDVPIMAGVRLSTLVGAMGWEEAKKQTDVREFLQRLGLAARDHLGPDVWVEPIIQHIDEEGGLHYVITDVRFPNEFSALTTSFNDTVMLKLTRESAPSAGNHISETALADAEWDIIMGNNGSLDDLEANLVAALDL